MFFLSFAAGQRHVSHPGCQEPDECRCPHREGFLRGLHQVRQGVRHGGRQLPRGLLAHEGPREEAPGEEREAGGVPDQSATRLPEEAHLARASPQRVQGHGLVLTSSTRRRWKKDELLPPCPQQKKKKDQNPFFCFVVLVTATGFRFLRWATVQ